ncbi:MAG: hypothetical protein JXQ83_13035 [Candidatus Glassbacteria bacterium]|nr:hypothetical protein [Candidatus Glassbacteria bacterium]
MIKTFLVLFLFSGAAALQAEVAVWTQSYLKPLSREEPVPSRPEKKIRLRAAPGEYEPAVFALRSDEPVPATVSLCGLEGADWLPAAWCELHRVEGLSDTTRPNRLCEFAGPVELAPGRTQFFWLTVRPPEDAGPGTYTGRVFIQARHQMLGLEISCEVLPFRLEQSPVIGGAFMAETDLPPGWYRDMKEHGIDAIQHFWAYNARVIRRGENPVLDLSPLDSYMTDIVASGMRGPVVISLGNDYHLHFERRLAEAFDIPIDTSGNIDGKRIVGPAISPRLDTLFVRGLHQIRDHWKARAYPQELVVLIYDEPTERLLARGKNRYDLLKTAMPGTRVYGVVMDRREWAESMLDQMDIIVANGDFEACRELARANGKGFWIYGGVRSVHGARYDKGCLPWRVGAEGTFFWMYNYWDYDPDGCAVYHHPDDPEKLVRSTVWEAIREGIDDLRYFATAENLAARAPSAGKAPAVKKLEALKNSLEPGQRRRAPRGLGPDDPALLEYYTEPDRVRNGVIEIILELL